MFPEKADNKGLGYNENAPIEILWDDGIRMAALLEGSLTIDGLRYPNKISSFRSKKIMGDYLRRRMGIPKGKFVTKQMFDHYGRIFQFRFWAKEFILWILVSEVLSGINN